MKLIELIIDDTMELSGIDAVSIVENPAIEENFLALKSDLNEYKFAEVSKDKKIIMGALLVPDKPIYRRDEENGEYYIYFSKDTIRQCMELFFKNGNQSKATFEHLEEISGLTMVESWIVEDSEKDKSKLYELNVPVGTWMGTIKVDNDVIWNDFIKTGKVKGFSIEGYFADKAKMPLSKVDQVDTESENDIDAEIEAGLELLKIQSLLNDFKKKTILKSYNDYPKEASENAKIALNYAEKNGWGSCGTPVGKIRANQLANGENISEDTISRMASFERHRQNSKRELGDGCGRLMWLAWGGDAGIEWASRKLQQIRKKDLAINKISFDYDSTLSTAKGTELAKKLIKQGNDIYIISARHLKNGMLTKAKELGIQPNRIYATGSNKNKIAKIKSLKIVTHYDNNENVIKELGTIGKLFTNE